MGLLFYSINYMRKEGYQKVHRSTHKEKHKEHYTIKAKSTLGNFVPSLGSL